MVVFPIVAALVSALFALLLVQQYARKKGLPQLFWGVALSMFALASLAVAAGVGQGWNGSLYRIFWAFGAILNVPFLALGSVSLFGNRPLIAVAALIVAALSIYVLALTFTAKTQANAFVQHHESRAKIDCPADPIVPLKPRYDIPRGKCVWPHGSAVGKMGSTVSIPSYLVVVLVALITSRGSAPERRRRARGNWMITAGATIVAVGGTATARFGRGAAFSIALALGVVVMFAGFLMASRAQRSAEAVE
jgi:hypothetical protein